MTEGMWEFFAGYFHQDWKMMADSWQGIVDNYARDARNDPPSERRALIRDIDKFRRTHSEAELDQALADSGASYRPRPPATYKEWFGQVAERLRQHADAVENGTTR